MYGEQAEVYFQFHSLRPTQVDSIALGLKPVAGTVLLSDGYAAYARYAEKAGITHAQC